MKKLLLLIALLLPALFVTAQGIKNGLKEEPKINAVSYTHLTLPTN